MGVLISPKTHESHLNKRRHKWCVQTPQFWEKFLEMYCPLSQFWEKFLEVEYILTEKFKQKKNKTPKPTGWDRWEVQRDTRRINGKWLRWTGLRKRELKQDIDFHLCGLGRWAWNLLYKQWIDPWADQSKLGLKHSAGVQGTAPKTFGKIPARPVSWVLCPPGAL